MPAPSSPRPLPERASLEHLRKEAKRRLRELRAQSSRSRVTLSEVQDALAREYGFRRWPDLAEAVNRSNPPGLRTFHTLAARVAHAYKTADIAALRAINWEYGTSFEWHRDPLRMRSLLHQWSAMPGGDDELALSDAREIVARHSGFSSWATLVASVARPRATRRPSAGPEFFSVDRETRTIRVRGPLAPAQWEVVFDTVAAEQLTGIRAGGVSDDVLERMTRLKHITRLCLDNSNRISDAGLMHLSKLGQLAELDISGPRSVFTDRGLAVLSDLPELRVLALEWAPFVTDAGLAAVSNCQQLEKLNVMGTATGDDVLRALAGMRRLQQIRSGRLVTDAGVAALHEVPTLQRWRPGDTTLALGTFLPKHATVLLDGPITRAGLREVRRLDGLFGLHLFWHATAITSHDLESLSDAPHLGFVGCSGRLLNDVGLTAVARMPRLQMLLADGISASDDAFVAFSKNESMEYFAIGGPPQLRDPGFSAIATRPRLRGLTVNIQHISRDALSRLAHARHLRELFVSGATDQQLSDLAACESLEDVTCVGNPEITDTGILSLAMMPSLRRFTIGRNPRVSPDIVSRIPETIQVEIWQ